MFCSLVLLIKTINTYVICTWGHISFISRNIDKKNQMAETEVAEAETETPHSPIIKPEKQQKLSRWALFLFNIKYKDACLSTEILSH